LWSIRVVQQSLAPLSGAALASISRSYDCKLATTIDAECVGTIDTVNEFNQDPNAWFLKQARCATIVPSLAREAALQ
jgi:hypothetical protein